MSDTQPSARSVLAAIALALLAEVGSAAPGPPAPPLVIAGVTVIDPPSGEVMPGRTVVVADGSIVSVSPSGNEAPPADATVIDAAGKYLIPGLWDMHTHLDSHTETDLMMLVANGVLDVRDMGGDPFVVLDMASRAAAGEIVGPSIRAAGAILEDRRWLTRVRREFPHFEHRLPVDNPEEARATIALLASWGVDLVKTRNVADRETLAAILDAARAHGLTVAGHEPMVVDLDAAAALGMTTFEHVPFLTLTLPGKEADAERVAVAIETLLASGAYIDPTLIASHRLGDSREERAAALAEPDERYRYLPASVRAQWEASLDDDPGPLPWAAMRERSLAIARQMHAAGIPFLAGTDMGVPLTFPGFALHDELALLVRDLGLTPLEALRTATSAPAALFGVAAGGIAPGMAADLVLLDADPLADIANAKAIHAVVLRGELLDRARLDALLAHVRQHKDDPPPPSLFERLENACRTAPSAGCLERLAGYDFSKNDFAAARATYQEALAAGAGEMAREGLFASTINLLWDAGIDCAEAAASAAVFLDRHASDAVKSVGILDRLLPALAASCEAELPPFLRRLAAIDPAALDGEMRPIYLEHRASYLARVEGDEEAAYAARQAAMPAGWEKESAALQRLANWCLEQEVALERARALAQDAARVAATPIDRFQSMLLEARLAAALGDYAGAVALMETLDQAVPGNATITGLLETFREQAVAAADR